VALDASGLRWSFINRAFLNLPEVIAAWMAMKTTAA